MAKRRSANRASKRFLKNRSNDSIGSRVLNPDTSIMAEEQTHWWNNIEDENISLRSLMYNSRNETSQQLHLNSQLESNNTSQWWKPLESFNSGNTSTRSRPNLSAAIVTNNVVESSLSESEKELSLKKRKVQLKAANRKSNSNAFLDALNDVEDIPLKLQKKVAKYNLRNNSNSEIVKRKLNENEEDRNNSNLSSSPSSDILKLKPSIFKTRKSGGTKDQNPFQDVIMEEDNSDARRKSIMFKKKSSMHENINKDTNEDTNEDTNKDTNEDTNKDTNENTNEDHIDDQRKTRHLSQTLSPEKNIASDTRLNKTIESSNKSDIRINNRKHFKLRSYFLQRTQKSMDNNPFEDALVESRDITLPNNQDEQIDIHNTKSSLKTKLLNSSLEKNVNKSKIDITNKNVFTSSPRRSPRFLKTNKNHSLDISAQVQSNIEQSTSNSSLDNNEFHIKRPTYLKLKSKNSSLHEKSIINNSFKKILMESDINVRKSNIAVPTKDNHISVEQDKITTEISQGQVIVERYSQPTRHENSDINKNSDISLKESSSLSSENENVSKNVNVQLEKKNKSLESNDVNISKSISQRNVIIENNSTTRHENSDINKNSDISLKESSSLSSENENVSKNVNVQLEKKNKSLESNDVNISKSISQRNVIIENNTKVLQNKKQISFSRESTKDISGISKEHTNAISLADRTNIDEIEAHKVTNNNKYLNMKDTPSTSNIRNLLTSQVVNTANFEKMKAEVDRLKIREMAVMKMVAEKKESALKVTNVKLSNAMPKKSTRKKNPSKVVDKAYLVNGVVYKPPRLPRPKHWATNHLYKFLWKRMEPKYKLSTRMRSEKFVTLLAQIFSIIERRKKYKNYKHELEILMKEMARLNIINTRNDFYHFCQEFMPYAIRIKVIPMLLPGNKRNIPFEPEKLHIPLLEEPNDMN